MPRSKEEERLKIFDDCIKKGMFTDEIASAMGISPSCLREYMSRKKWKNPNSKFDVIKKNTEKKIKRYKELSKSGVSKTGIAKILGTSYISLHSLIKRHGAE